MLQVSNTTWPSLVAAIAGVLIGDGPLGAAQIWASTCPPGAGSKVGVSVALGVLRQAELIETIQDPFQRTQDPFQGPQDPFQRTQGPFQGIQEPLWRWSNPTALSSPPAQGEVTRQLAYLLGKLGNTPIDARAASIAIGHPTRSTTEDRALRALVHQGLSQLVTLGLATICRSPTNATPRYQTAPCLVDRWVTRREKALSSTGRRS